MGRFARGRAQSDARGVAPAAASSGVRVRVRVLAWTTFLSCVGGAEFGFLVVERATFPRNFLIDDCTSPTRPSNKPTGERRIRHSLRKLSSLRARPLPSAAAAASIFAHTTFNLLMTWELSPPQDSAATQAAHNPQRAGDAHRYQASSCGGGRGAGLGRQHQCDSSYMIR